MHLIFLRNILALKHATFLTQTRYVQAKMNSFIKILIFLLVSFSAFSQNNEFSKSDLKRLFKKSILQNSKKSISTYSNPWVSDNTDSLYYKSDTIKLYGFKTKPYLADFCESVNWSFYEKSKFFLAKAHFCKEPPTVTANAEHFNIKFLKTKTEFIIELYKLNILTDKFKVLEIINNDLQKTIILKRLNI